MKANRLNLITSIRRGLIAEGYSTVKVVAAVNAALGETKLVETTDKTGDGRVTKEGFRVTVTGTFKYEGKRTMPLLFDAWHSTIAKAEKIATVEVQPIPSIFRDHWLDKFAKADKKELDKETETMVADAKAAANA